MGNKKWIIAIAVLALAGALLVWDKTRIKPKTEVPPTKRNSAVPEAMVALMKARIAPVSQSEPVEQAVLPADILATIRAGNSQLLTGKVTYAGGAKGFLVQYYLANADLKEFPYIYMREVVGNGVWTIMHIATSPGFSFFEIENAKHEARISMSPKNGKIFVSVEAVIK